MTVRYKELAWTLNRTMSRLSQVQRDVSGANSSRKAGLLTPQPEGIVTGFVKLKELEAKVQLFNDCLCLHLQGIMSLVGNDITPCLWRRSLYPKRGTLSSNSHSWSSKKVLQLLSFASKISGIFYVSAIRKRCQLMGIIFCFGGEKDCL
jgi:hypothetical protein